MRKTLLFLCYIFSANLISAPEATDMSANIISEESIEHKSISPKQLPDNFKKEKCPACNYALDGILNVLKTRCNHFYHTKCLEKRQVKNLNSCLVCQATIGDIKNGEEQLVIDKELTADKDSLKKMADKAAAIDKKEKGISGVGLSYEELPDDKKTEKCSLCGDDFANSQNDFNPGDFYKTECNHYFHGKCLVSLQENGLFSCPTCKTQLAKATPLEAEPKNVVFDSVAFEKVQLKSFIDFISDLKQMNYVPNADANNIETSLSIREPLTADQAYNVFLSVLEMAGFSHIKVGDIYKIVKKEAKYSEPLPIFVGRPSTELPESDKTVRFVTFLKNLSVSDVDGILKSLLTPGAPVIPLQNLNGFVVSDRCANIKAAMRIINELDNSGNQEMVSLIKLKETNATEVKTFLELLMKKPEGSAIFRVLSGAIEGSIDYFPHGIKIIADERTNTLILLGMKSALKRVEDFITNFVDKGLVNVESPLHIYECQYMDSESMKQIVEAITSNDSSSAASKFGGIRGGLKYFGPMKVEADKIANRLIFSCSDKSDWEMLQKLLVDLDKPQPQVSIETLIVDIQNTDSKSLGGQIRNRTAGSPIPGVNFQNSMAVGVPVLSNAGQSIVSLLGNLVSGVANLAQGETLLALGANDDVWAILRALNTQVKASVISNPSITVSNREEGITAIGQTARIINSETITGVSSAGYTNVSADTTLRYEPQINQEGLINLKVTIDIKDFINSDPNNTTTRNLTTNVTVADGQVMVLGGFVKTSASETSSKTPILSNIPILGWMFKNKEKRMEKTYTFFFVVTNIQKPRKTPGVNLYTKMKLHDAYDTVNDCVEMLTKNDPLHNSFFNPKKEEFAHKVVDFANARYQPTTVDLSNDKYFKVQDFENLSDTSSKKNKLKTLVEERTINQIVRTVPSSGIDIEHDSGIINLSSGDTPKATNHIKNTKSSIHENAKNDLKKLLEISKKMPSEKRELLRMIASDEDLVKYVKKEKLKGKEEVAKNYMAQGAEQSLIKYLNQDGNLISNSESKTNDFAKFLNTSSESFPKLEKRNHSTIVSQKENLLKGLLAEERQTSELENNRNNLEIISQKDKFLKSLFVEDQKDSQLVANKNTPKSSLQKREMLRQLLAQDDNGEE